jgi:hypothetical protein
LTFAADLLPSTPVITRALTLAVVFLFAGSTFAEAGTRLRGSSATRPWLGVEKNVRTPKKRTPIANIPKPRKNRGSYPYVGRRKTPKRLFL